MEKETGNTRGDDTLAAAASVPTDKATSPAFKAMMSCHKVAATGGLET